MRGRTPLRRRIRDRELFKILWRFHIMHDMQDIIRYIICSEPLETRNTKSLLVQY